MKKVKAANILEDILIDELHAGDWLDSEYDGDRYKEHEQRVKALEKAIKVLRKGVEYDSTKTERDS